MLNKSADKIDFLKTFIHRYSTKMAGMSLKLNNGSEMPIIGLGTYKVSRYLLFYFQKYNLKK